MEHGGSTEPEGGFRRLSDAKAGKNQRKKGLNLRFAGITSI